MSRSSNSYNSGALGGSPVSPARLERLERFERLERRPEMLDSSDGGPNNLRFVGSQPPVRPATRPSPGLTRSARTLNLMQIPAINDYMDSWSPFEEQPERPATLKRSASKSELSPFVNDPAILRKWRYKQPPDPALRAADVAANATAEAAAAKHRKTLDQQAFSGAVPDQTAFASSGLVSKTKSHLMPQKITTPDTPVKKSPLAKNTSVSSIMDSPVDSHTSITVPFGSSQASPLGSASSRFESSNISSSFLPSAKTKRARASKMFSNTVLTSTLQQFTDDLYGNDDDDSFLSDCVPSTAPTITFSADPSSPSRTPTKAPFAIKQPSPFMTSRPRRSINAKISRPTSPSVKQFQTSPDSHLSAKFLNVGSIGSGQFSTVYQVTFQPTNTKYAVKSMRPDKFNTTARILQEIDILSTISESKLDEEGKEYVLDFISSWKYQGYFYVMTEYCENGDLDTFLKKQIINKNSRLEDWRIWKIIVELSLALRFVHDSCQIAHLDLKPANVLITFEGSLKLADFGMAAKLPVGQTELENEGDREYIAPEIISDCIYDFRADIFSLGLMIVEIAANVVLPSNGNAWHKLRSGDLSDAGKLSSTEIHSDSLFSTGNTNTELTNLESCEEVNKLDFLVDHSSRIPAWVPKFLIDGVSLERMVRRMIDPNYKNRPTADEILHSEECEYVEMTRKAGAIIQEDDFGPKPDFST